jgi:signal peptidase I
LSWQPPPGAGYDDDLGEHLAIEASVAGDDAAALGLETAPSPLPRAGESARHKHVELPDLSRLDAAHSDAPLPPRADDDRPRYTQRVTPEFDQSPRAVGPTGGGRRAHRRMLHKARRAPWWELPLLVAVAIVVAVLVKTFVVQPFYIPSQSMEKTLHGCPGCHGDRILVNKPIYDLRDPHPGDIVVFHAPQGWDDEPPSEPPSNPVLRVIRGFGQLVGFVPPDGLVLVKRVIAVGGQTVKGNAAGQVLVSDHGAAGPWRTLDEPYVYLDGTDSHATFGPVTVPKGRLWVMGDHRNDSADSRFHCGVGGSQGDDGSSCDPTTSTVPDSDVIGKAMVIAWPPSRWRTLGTPSTFKHVGALAPVAGGELVTVLPLLVLRRRRRRRGDGRRA